MVRSAGVEDAAAIAAVHVATWRSAYRGLLPDEFLESLAEAGYEGRWRRSLAEGAGRVYVAEEDGHVVGFASGGRERAGEDGYAGELYALYVLEDAQRRGNGHALVRAVARGLREMGLEDMIVWVLRDNPTARSFYERLGGVYVRSQPITIGPALLQEVSYGWKSLDSLDSLISEEAAEGPA
ncbi:MAG TPA: GNAT family N-acetyltransferase [Candidatus Sulfotelmatobacter sp.]|nr:GNAT family N-acetyltransferase [Candidatus Sulfotelmatobacter sp.]